MNLNSGCVPGSVPMLEMKPLSKDPISEDGPLLGRSAFLAIAQILLTRFYYSGNFERPYLFQFSKFQKYLLIRLKWDLPKAILK